MAVSKVDLENALDKIKKTLEKNHLDIPQELEQLQKALDEAVKTIVSNSNKSQKEREEKKEEVKKEVERLRRDVTNKFNELRSDWPEEVQDILDPNEEPCIVIDPLYGHEFEIDPETDLD